MENRTILIANTKTQQRHEIQTNATTLGELKAQMVAQGIDFSGMTFTEGLSKTQLMSDASLLPTNVMFKGAPTNNLVMLLTNTQKNIASGAGTRKEAYEALQQLGDRAKEDIKNIYGRNFTQVSTDKLWEYIDDYTCDEEDEFDDEDELEEEDATEKESTPSSSHPCLVEWFYMGLKSMLRKNMLYTDDLEAITDLLTELIAREKETRFEVSDEDINKMIANL